MADKFRLIGTPAILGPASSTPSSLTRSFGPASGGKGAPVVAGEAAVVAQFPGLGEDSEDEKSCHSQGLQAGEAYQKAEAHCGEPSGVEGAQGECWENYRCCEHATREQLLKKTIHRSSRP